MKKILIISIAFVFMVGLGFINVFAIETTGDSPTIELTTEMSTEDARTYVYSNYQELISKIEEDMYADIYDDVYADIYQDVIDQINDNTYDQIYQDIENQLNDRLDDLALINDETQNQIYDVVELADASVVGIENYIDEEGVSVGSGVIYDYDEINDLYYVITNHHVIEDGNTFYVRFEDESNVSATLIKFDEDLDIALLSFSGLDLEGLQVAPLGVSSELVKGQILIAAGHPQGFNFFNSITLGIVAGVNREVGGETITYIQHDAAINSGNSGGPIFNLAGQVVGINVLKYADEEIEGMGFSIPIDLVIAFINE